MERQIKNHKNFKIIEYRPEYKEKYKELNYEWLEKYFEIEPSDEKILSDPEKEIIDKNGFIFFALFKEEVIGTCTLVKHDDTNYELSKMCVVEKYQGKGAGKKLIEKAISKALSIGVKRIFLYTSKKLTPAINLYTKKGFKIISKSTILNSSYKRDSIYMFYDLNNDCDKDKLKLLLVL